ncbi:hypothetical protein BpHYR1_049649 [Brachionus plicatilis]|uniref:Uncharacterized protein n=1 Tax=Brachionus plicatilis TaxID=10195 RepID=A0A3M7R5N9_BRAPC|nr:hypothetical protein BpHYR1_049649 [Brachionus plicatilis]
MIIVYENLANFTRKIVKKRFSFKKFWPFFTLNTNKMSKSHITRQIKEKKDLRIERKMSVFSF